MLGPRVCRILVSDGNYPRYDSWELLRCVVLDLDMIVTLCAFVSRRRMHEMD